MIHHRPRAFFSLALALTACSSAGGNSGSDDELTGTATAAVTLAPTNVLCVSIKVVGKKTVKVSYDVAPETSTVFTLTGLPFGKDAFSATAYSVACSDVTVKTPPTYLSDTVYADVQPNNSPAVTLQMVSPEGGGAVVGLNFPTPSGTFNEFSSPTPNSDPNRLATGPDGNVWFTELEGNAVARVTPSGTITEFPLTGGPGIPGGITAGPDGNLWFVEAGGADGGNDVARMTPTGTEITRFPTPTPNSGPSDITAGPDGALWFTEFAANNVARILVNGFDHRVPGPHGERRAGGHRCRVRRQPLVHGAADR